MYIFYFMCIYVFLNVYACILDDHRVQKWLSDAQQLELQVVMNLLIWVLGTTSRSSVRSAGTLNRVISSQAVIERL